MQYRILYKLIEPCLEPKGFYIFGLLLFIFAPICIIYILLPVIDRKVLNWCIFGATSEVLLGASVMLTFCIVNQRVQRFYHLIFESMAFVANLNNQSRTGRNIIYQHSRSLLLKEVSEPEKLVNKFAPEAVGFKLTYGIFLKICFWAFISIMILSFSTSNHIYVPFYQVI